jgi:serine/threonine-protein kinase
MGVVVCATHLGLDERVAIKFLAEEHAERPEVVDRFLREAWAAAKIKSDYVVRVHDVATLDDGTPYIVMEHLSGEDLASCLERGPIPTGWAVDQLLQAAEALAEAHKLGIVHRDLKPGNLFLSRRTDGTARIKVLDFGISKVKDGGGITMTNSVLGSPAYMAPEQIRSPKSVDARSDIWALGAVLFEMVTGVRAFDAETLPQAYIAVIQDEPRSFAEVAPTLPAALEAVIRRCLEKSPDGRFSDLAEMARALVPFGGPSAKRSSEAIARLLGSSGQTTRNGERVLGKKEVLEEASTLDSGSRTARSVVMSPAGAGDERGLAATTEGPITAPHHRGPPQPPATMVQASPPPIDVSLRAAPRAIANAPVDTPPALTATVDRPARSVTRPIAVAAVAVAVAAAVITAGVLRQGSSGHAEDPLPVAAAEPSGTPPPLEAPQAAPPTSETSTEPPPPPADSALAPPASTNVPPAHPIRPPSAAARSSSTSTPQAKPTSTTEDPWKAMTRDR